MLRRTDLHVFAATGIVILGVFAACTVNTTDNTTKADAGASSTSSSSSGGQSSTSSSTSSGGTSSGGTSSGSVGACGTTANADLCLDCCGMTDAVDQIYAKASDDCACAGPCATDCSSWCATRGAAPPPACLTCLEADSTQTACDAKVHAECIKDPACAKVEECATKADCDGKPLPK